MFEGLSIVIMKLKVYKGLVHCVRVSGIIKFRKTLNERKRNGGEPRVNTGFVKTTKTVGPRMGLDSGNSPRFGEERESR